MPYLLFGLLLFLLATYALRMFQRSNPAAIARALKRGGGLGALAAAIFLALRGRLDMALGLGGLGLWLLGLNQWRPGVFRNAGQPGAVSRVRSAMIEMELDHETGAMRGMVLAGRHEGMPLDSLTRAQCEDLYRTCLADDPDGARLLEAYMDRRFAGWRQAGHGQGDARGADAGQRRASAMTEDEAYEVLGLQKGATSDEITRAHRALMKKLHPDHGGSTSLAARVNEAKDVLMRRHH
mgnify:FL=1